jgi:hypothetical protein
MACNLNDDPFGWYGHNRYNDIEETSSPVGDFGRSPACVRIGAAPRYRRNHADSISPQAVLFHRHDCNSSNQQESI